MAGATLAVLCALLVYHLCTAATQTTGLQRPNGLMLPAAGGHSLQKELPVFSETFCLNDEEISSAE